MPIILDGTKGETFPSWTTGTRPASPNTGQTGYNTTLGGLETYNGSAWVTPNFGPAFSAYATAAQTINVNTFTKIQLPFELFDTNNAFDSTTNYRFQPTVAGYYQISGAVSSAALGTILTSIFKNGSEAARGFQGGIGAATSTCTNVSSLLYLNGSSDYAELYYFQTGSSPSASTSGSVSTTYFNGGLVRAA